jgi:tetratricopeptide (TPR) repeat protein
MILISNIKSICLIFLFLVGSVLFQKNITVPKIPPIYLRPPETIKYFTFGYADAFASVLWMRVLQNFDYCEGGKYQGSDYVPPVQGAKSNIQGVLLRKIKPSRCHKGWVYSMLDTMTELQPRFKIAYDIGAPFLSVAVDDREGARLIFEKGIKLYPKEWMLTYAAGYHYLWEMQDPDRSAELLLQSLKNGGPTYLASLVAGLYTEVGQAQLAYDILMENLKKNPPEEVKERIYRRLKEIEPILKSQKNSL